MDIPEDADVRNNYFQCRGIIVKDNKVLVMFRRKKGREYYVFPGGHMRNYEKPIDTAIREIYEETTIKVKNLKPAYDQIIHTNPEQRDYYFVGYWESGEPTLSGEESRRCSEENFYKPMWVNISEVTKLELYPEAAKEWVNNYLKNSLMEEKDNL
jgi:8-oxo-dGTP pyrophosphatase MutT (NUDIX family)